ncbi:hypothetical protein, partial [Staphylococcus aureus]
THVNHYLESTVCSFFKQKTAYEMQRSLVGSEMCIRDRICSNLFIPINNAAMTDICLLYTSDAADD